MYKIIENNQIIDVLDTMSFVRYLPKSKRIIAVDERQANGCISSNGEEIYHIFGTPYNFIENKRSVKYESINEEEYIKLTTQLKENQDLIARINALELKLEELERKLNS